MIGSSVSLIIPAYNEENTIRDVINSTAGVMDSLGLPYEIIVINDGSTDNTEMAALSTGYKIKYFSNETNRGKGYSLRRGVQHAKGDIIITLDSDGEHKPKEIPSLLTPLFEGTEVVSGSRFLGNGYHGVTSKINQIGNYLFNLAIMILTGNYISDSQTGFRAMRKEVFEKLNLQSDGFEIETEITVKSLISGFRFKEVPITVERRKHSASKIKIISDGRKILRTIIRSSISSFEPFRMTEFSSDAETKTVELQMVK